MTTNVLVNEIIDRINDQDFYALYVTAIRGFRKDPSVVPISKITFSVVPEENKTTYFEDKDARQCVRSDIKIRLNVYAPTNRNGNQINGLAELVMDYLAEYYIENLKSYSIGDMSYDDDVNAILLPCYMNFSYTSCALETGETDIESNVPDTFFCKSHVNNSDIHISAEEKAYLASPYILGGYTGTGADKTQDIFLGFRPSFVIVFRNSYHASLYSSDDGISKCYMSMAGNVSYMRGLQLLEDGFRVRTYATANATTYLNDEGGSYTFIALK